MKHLNLLLCCFLYCCIGLQTVFAENANPTASDTYDAGLCTDWLNPSPTTGWTNFGDAPCDDGTGCPFNEILTFEIFASEAYTLANVAMGGTYTFSACNSAAGAGMGGQAWPIDFTIIAPSGTVDAFGLDAGSTCELTWTASEAGTYLLVVTEEGACGTTTNTAVNNGFPAVTCASSPETACAPAETACNAGTLVSSGPVEVCPGETTTFAVTGDSIPTGGSYNIQFDDSMGGTGGVAGGFPLTGVPLPYTFDAGLNGVLAFNGIPDLAGTWLLTGFVTDADGNNCNGMTATFEVVFSDFTNPNCIEITSCEAGTLVSASPVNVCPEETATVQSTGDTIPNSPLPGGYGWEFLEGPGGSGGLAGGFTITNASNTYTFDNDLNGVLSTNSLPPLAGTWFLTGVVYSDVADPLNTVCDTTDMTFEVNFLDATDPICMAMPCTDWLNPTDSTGWTNFNTGFGGAPCDDGTGCPFNEITAFEVWASEAYLMDNVVMGGTYVFSACNNPGGAGMGGQAWPLEFTIISPSGNVDAFGLDSGSTCELTWTASESGTYIIAVTEAGACGTTTNTNVNNGFPAVTCVSSPETACPPAPANDDCANATQLTLDVPTMGTNISATVSQAEFDATTGVGILAVCSPPNGFSIENAVWFTFTAVNPGNHTVALTNVSCPQSMAIYPTADIDCTDINNSTLDGPDATCIALPAGGDSTVVSLPAGDYYIIIDGSGGAACDFDLEVYEGPTCLLPNELTAVIGTDGMSADLSWLSDETVFNVEWDTTGFAQGTGNLETGVGNPFSLTGLMPSTTYDYYVQADCGANGISDWVGPFTFTTAPPAPVCGGNFYDIGGVDGDYGNNANDTYTICPDNPGDAVTVEFITVAIESATGAGSDGTGCWDYLSIYNGADATAPLLGDFCTTPGTGTGMTLSPGDSFTSVDASGCLTFVFTSDGSVPQAGWEALVTCAPGAACPAPIAGTATNITDSSADLSWSSDETVFNIEWDTAGFTPGTGMMVDGVGNPYSLTGLSPETTYEYYVCAVCTDSTGGTADDIVITGAFDGPLSGGTPKGIELYVANDIADMSLYGVSSANNGSGTTMTPEYTFPAGSVAAGTFIYVASDSVNFADFFEFNADYTSNAMLINGDDAVELYYNGAVIDVMGDVDVDGSGEAWEYQDGWAYRNSGQGANGGTFDANNWTYSGTNQLEGDTLNATTMMPFPLGTYTAPTGGGGTTVSECAGPFAFTTGFPDPSCSTGVFYDNGGSLFDYANNSSDSITICPDNPGDFVTVTFTSVAIESATGAGTDSTGCWDYLSVFDGAGTTNPFGDFCTSPGTGTAMALGAGDAFTSTDASGCLTFVFNSDFTVTEAGWEATVSCAPPACPTDLGLSATTTGESGVGTNDGSIDLTVSGQGTAPYTFTWDNGATTEDLSGLAAGTYCVTVTDADGCTDNACYDILSLCSANWTYSVVVEYESGLGTGDGSIDLTTIGGTAPYTYLWSNGATTEDLTGLTGNTTYTVQITDATGCTVSYDVFVGIDCPPNFGVTANVMDMEFGLMNGAIDITTNAGNPPFTYQWSNNETTEDISGLTPGTYAVTITDAAACTDVFTATVEGVCPSNLYLSTNVTDETVLGQNDGAVDLLVGGGVAPFTYLWNTGAATEDISGLGAGQYCVTVTGAMGCTGTICATVAAGCDPVLITSIDVTDESEVGVNDGAIDLSVTGTNPTYTYNWDNGATTADLTGLAGGVYCVTVTDGTGCTETACATVNTICPGDIALSAAVTDESQVFENDGEIDLTVTGGTQPYTYLWDNVQTTEDLIGLAPGVYCVVVTDANGCTADACYTVVQGCPMNLITTVSITDAVGGNNGAIDLTVGNGTSPYTFMWDNGAMTEDLNGLGAGTYTITVTDANGCVDTETYTVLGEIAISGIEILTNLQLFPNPANQQAELSLTFSASADVRVEVIDVIGQVLEQRFNENTLTVQHTFDLTHYAEGLYFIRVSADGQQVTKRLAVIRE